MYSTSAVSGRHGWVKIVLLGGMGMEWELTGVKWGRLADRDRDRRLANIGVYRTPVAILALTEKLKDVCLVAFGIEESKVGFVVVSTMENSNGKQSEEAPVLKEPELAQMSWGRFGRRFEKRSGQKIMSFKCFHTGTTTSVRKSTIRTTARGGNAALIMESDSGEYFVAISKAQGCDEIKILDPNF